MERARNRIIFWSIASSLLGCTGYEEFDALAVIPPRYGQTGAGHHILHNVDENRGEAHDRKAVMKNGIDDAAKST